MADSFHAKVRAAAMAGWWTLLVAVLVAVLQWAGLMLLLHHRPPWVQAMLPSVTWETIQNIGLILIVVVRLMILTMFLAVVWLTIWAAKLKGTL